jgi:lipoprotein-anchoring transpeptidase ErfK/SrfK
MPGRTVGAMSTRRLSRLVLLLLAAAAVAAAALPSAEAAAAPAPSAAACVKAKKKVKVAKAKLSRAKRGAASARARAKAGRGVRRAQKAQRAACRIPVPGPGPAPPAPAPAPNAGPAAAPAPADPHEHHHEEPAPQPQPGPGPGPDTKPTSHALIAKALQDGRIDAETALRYEVFAEHGDPRLPAEYKGAPLEQADTDTLDRVAERWDELSPATRQALDPYFVPPFNAGSWYDLAAAPTGVAARRAPPGAPGADLCESTAPNMKRWGYVTAAQGTLRVWYENTVGGQQAKAIAVAEHLDGGAYAKLKDVFRAPLPDGGGLTENRCRGLDPAVDLALVPLTGPNGESVRYAGEDACNGPFPGFAVIRRDLTGDDLMAAVIHEVSHLAHFAYGGNRCGRYWDWLTEANAQWMVTHADDYAPKHPESYAGNFFDRPGEPLETYDETASTTVARQYGAYLFFQWLANNNSAEAVSEVWDGMESTVSAVERIQTVLTARGYAGGFEEAWKEFALAGLNPREKADWFGEWGGLKRGAHTSFHPLLTDQTATIPVDLPHLAAQYHAVTFSDAVKGVEVTNPLAGQTGASVQVWLKIADGGTERVEIRDWTASAKETFCREIPAENVQELVLVIANSTHTPWTHKLHDDPTVRTTGSCGAYDATSKATIKRDGLTEVYTAAYSLTPLWTRPAEGGGTESFFSTDNTKVSGNASWSMSGVSRTTGCTWSGQATIPVGPGMMQATLLTRDFGKDDPRSTYAYGFGIAFHVGEVTITCPNGDVTKQPWQLGHGFQSDPKPWDPDGQGIVGSESESHPAQGVEIKREWVLSRKAIARVAGRPATAPGSR